ncbi:MAG: hypothetical protein IJM01_07800, partial [Eubacterium sp.]|nr:hypothetical protein [Eubacterium sp.]
MHKWGVDTTNSIAAAKPKVGAKASVEVNQSKKLSIKAKGFKIKSVKAKTGDKSIATVSASKKAITITGVAAGETVISTTIKASKKKAAPKTYKLKTKVTVTEAGSPDASTTTEIKKNGISYKNTPAEVQHFSVVSDCAFKCPDIQTTGNKGIDSHNMRFFELAYDGDATAYLNNATLYYYDAAGKILMRRNRYNDYYYTSEPLYDHIFKGQKI